MGDPEGILHFLARLERRQRWQALCAAFLRTALWSALAVFLVAWLAPAQVPLALALGGLVSLGAGLGKGLRTKVAVLSVDAALGLADRLPTWQGVPEAARADAVARWLGTSLASEVGRLPPERVRATFPLRLGRVRLLVPLLVVLLLLTLFAPLAPPGDLGVLLGSGGAHPGGSAPTRGGVAANPGGAGAQTRPPQQAASRPESQRPESRPASQGDAPDSRPLLPLTPRDELVVPELVREGATRKALAPVADLDVGPAGSEAPPPRAQGALHPDVAARDPEGYRRAVEEAMARRAVPVGERPFVRRYFEELARRGR